MATCQYMQVVLRHRPRLHCNGMNGEMTQAVRPTVLPACQRASGPSWTGGGEQQSAVVRTAHGYYYKFTRCRVPQLWLTYVPYCCNAVASDRW
jgi:hypothetical protein